MQIRKLTDTDRESVFHVLSQAFMRGDRDRSWFERPMPPLDSYGLWEGDSLQATATVLAFDIHVGPEVVAKMGGVAGVASLPASRGKGYARDLMRAALEGMRERGQAVSVLFPFSIAFYRALGWDWVGLRRRYAVPARVFRPSPETDRVRAAAPDDREAIVGVYTRFAHRYRGMVRRHPIHWSQILDDTDKEFVSTYLYERPSGPEGYLTYRGGKEEETHIREFICLTPEARRGLLGLLRRLQMQVGKFAWYAPGDDLLWHDLADREVETTFRPAAMGRVVDVPGALRLMTPRVNAVGAVVVQIRDDLAAWNAGAWRVEFAGSEVSVTATQSKPQVSLSIQALSQAWFGWPNLDEVRAAGRVEVDDEAGFAALRTLLAGPPMWISDDF